MAKKLKVFGWYDQVTSDHPAREGLDPWRSQVRVIMAATSKAAVARAVGAGDPRQLFNLEETGNDEEVEAAMGQPGVALCRGIDERRAPFVPLLRDEPEKKTGHCEVSLNDGCVDPPGYQVGSAGGPVGENPEPGRTRKECGRCGQLCCRGCRDRQGVCADCREDERANGPWLI